MRCSPVRSSLHCVHLRSTSLIGRGSAGGGGLLLDLPGLHHSSARARLPVLVDLPQLFLPEIDLSPHTLSIAELAMLAFSPGWSIWELTGRPMKCPGCGGSWVVKHILTCDVISRAPRANFVAAAGTRVHVLVSIVIGVQHAIPAPPRVRTRTVRKF